jgi:hypothetical protein
MENSGLSFHMPAGPGGLFHHLLPEEPRRASHEIVLVVGVMRPFGWFLSMALRPSKSLGCVITLPLHLRLRLMSSDRWLTAIVDHKLRKLGCFFMIALVMIATTAITKFVLRWSEFDSARQDALSREVGEYVGKGLFGVAVFLGFIIMGFQLIAELRAKRGIPPQRPQTPPPLPSERLHDRERR